MNFLKALFSNYIVVDNNAIQAKTGGIHDKQSFAQKALHRSLIMS